MSVDDVELVTRARRGDRDAFTQLVDRYGDMVYGLAWHLTGDFEDARDLAQDAFVRAYVRLPQLHRPERFNGWLRRITVNLQRSRARRKSIPTVPLSHADDPVALSRRVSESESAVREALLRLGTNDRLTLTLHYVNGYSQREIADFLETKASVVKTRLARARARLRQEVVAMVEHTFDAHKLPLSFGRDVIAGLSRMVGDLRRKLPPDPKRLLRSVYQRRNALWREVYANLPAAFRDKVAEQGQARPVPVSAYPSDLKETARQAIHWTWLWDMLRDVLAELPWARDTDALWVRVRRAADGTLQGCIADVPGTCGNIHCVHEFLNPPAAASHLESVDPECPPLDARDAVQLLRSLNEDVLAAAEGLRASLLTALPGGVAEFKRALHAETCAAFGAVYRHLPPEFLERMGRGAGLYDGEAISGREFDEELRQLVKRAIALYSAYGIVRALANPRFCGDRFDRMSLEFGFYRPMPDLPDGDDMAGKEYVELRTGEGEARGCQTGIWQSE